MMNHSPQIGRRQWLQASACGFGYLAFRALAAQAAEQEAALQAGPLDPKPQHFPAKANRIIFLYMRGGPSHVDTFDYKPQLQADNGKAAPGFGKKPRRDFLLGSPWKFSQQGQSGIHISELLPILSHHADKLCVLNGVYTDIPNHQEASILLHTGELRFVRPSVGSWVVYGLGSENQDLPGYISLKPTDLGGARNYNNVFLPAAYQGVPVGGGANDSDAIRDLSGSHLSPSEQRAQLDLAQAMNARLLERTRVNPELEGVIGSLEMGYRMQASVPKLMDLSQESADTLAMYGIEKSGGARRKGDTAPFGRQCLLARRFIEAGVRYVEISHGNWDHHSKLKESMISRCNEIDVPIAGLLTDLEQRGLLKETLLVWGGEFGRTPNAQTNQSPDSGRDHNHRGFTMWLAGGGVKGGLNYGATDHYGGEAVAGKMHIHDLHATMLHLLGLDHKKLTYRYGGRDYSLTDVHGHVPREILA